MQDLIKTLNMPNLDACFSTLVSSQTPLALATVIQAVSPTSGKPGNKALVSADSIVEGWIGGGCAQPAVVEAARNALASGQSCVIRVGPKGEWASLDGVVDYTSGCLSGGTLVIFIEPMIRKPTLSILGNSPVAECLANLATHLDFAVQQKEEFTNLDNDYIVIATQGKRDREALKAALASQARYIAMVASAKKIAGLKASLSKASVDAEQLDRIHSPAGIEIGATTPAEIALSILAELVSIRRDQPQAEESVDILLPAVDTVNEGGCCGG